MSLGDGLLLSHGCKRTQLVLRKTLMPFNSTFLPKIDRHFPMKTVKIYPLDKPWITPRIKHFIHLRQKLLRLENQVSWQNFTLKNQKEINVEKKQFYKSNIEGKIKGNPIIWHSKIKSVCRSQEKVDRIKVPGIDPQDFALIANAINTKFVKVWRCTRTILGPIIFLALINSALQDITGHWKYVDDMTIARWSLYSPLIRTPWKFVTVLKFLGSFGYYL